jgi:probable HAF family extracellular repeat protein
MYNSSHSSQGWGINDAGQVVGYYDTATGTRAFIWDAVNGMQDLGGGDGSIAYGINDAGQVVGRGGGYGAFIWDAVNGMQDLGDQPLPGGTYLEANGINDAGQVVGLSNAATGWRAFLWDEIGGAQDLGDLPGGADRSYAFGINDAGQVVGFSHAAFEEALFEQHAFVWDEIGGMQDLNDLIDPGLIAVLTHARGINASGQIVGYGFLEGPYDMLAFLLTPVSDVPIPASLVLMLGGIGALGGIAWRRKVSTPQA